MAGESGSANGRRRLEERMSGTLVAAVLLIEGYCSLAVEMIGLRMLVPVAGHSIGVTSIVVTVFLGSLAAGYAAGARFEGAPASTVARNLAIAAAWSAASLSYLAVRLLFETTAWLPSLGRVALYAALAVGPVAYLLSETVVILVRCQAGDGPSAKAGRVFTASTIGNVAGGLVTALVVMHYLGVAAATAVVVGLLAFGVVILMPRVRWGLGGLLAAGAVAAAANVGAEKRLFELTTPYGDYWIEEMAGGSRALRVNGQRASIDDAAGNGHEYVERIEEAVFARAEAEGKLQVLVIGAGGFTFGRGRARGAAEIVFVDVDDRLDEVAQAFLRNEPGAGRFEAADGRAFLLREAAEWDVILLDAYAEQRAMPSHLYTVEFFELARSRLAPGGWLFMNLIAREMPGKLEVRIERTLREAFARCDVDVLGKGQRWQNRVYRCERHQLDGDRTTYSDGSTLAEVDAMALW